MTDLAYRPVIWVEDLKPGECVIRRALGGGKTWWLLWFYVAREDNGALEDFAVPVNPRGGYIENGQGGRTWGLTDAGGGRWQVSPSINILGDKSAVPGAHPSPSMWHQTPTLVEVPAGQPWQ